MDGYVNSAIHHRPAPPNNISSAAWPAEER
jgi:hypothetical protein